MRSNDELQYVDIAVNGEEIDLKMKLMDSGVAFFVEEVDDAVRKFYLTKIINESLETLDSE